VRLALKRLAALRAYMRAARLGSSDELSILDAVGLTPAAAAEIYRLLALAYYSERFVLPTAERIQDVTTHINQGSCGYP